MHCFVPGRPVQCGGYLLRLRGRDVFECCIRFILSELLDLQCWLLLGGFIDGVHELRGGHFPAELGIELVRIVSRGLVLRSGGSYSGDGRVRGGPVLGLGRDGLQRLRERLLPRCLRAGLVHRLLERAVQRGVTVKHGVLELLGGQLPSEHGRGELHELLRG